MNITHSFLVHAPEVKTGAAQALRFLDKTILVKYDSVNVLQENCFSAEKDIFWQKITDGVAQNRQVLTQLIQELEDTGLQNLQDFTQFMEGYQSKTLHAAAHILDGFFGIDSVFYNLIADSHWVTDSLKQEIMSHPSEYWCIAVQGTFTTKSTASLIHAEDEKAN